jgi:excisionase family DNA binding protein
VLEAIAERAAELVMAQLDAGSSSPYLDVAEAAAFLRCSRQRVYDLLSARRLTRHRDGSRVLLERAELVEYVSGGVAPSLPRAARSRSARGFRGDGGTRC